VQLAFDRDHNNWDLPGDRVTLELIADGVAIEPWQLDIQNDQVRLLKLDGLKRRAAIGNQIDNVAG
jgi:hypothetical protein